MFASIPNDLFLARDRSPGGQVPGPGSQKGLLPGAGRGVHSEEGVRVQGCRALSDASFLGAGEGGREGAARRGGDPPLRDYGHPQDSDFGYKPFFVWALGLLLGFPIGPCKNSFVNSSQNPEF